MNPHCEKGPATPQMYEDFWVASREGREAYGLSPEPASDKETVENNLDLDRVLNDFSREEVRLVLRDIFTKAHQVLKRDDARSPQVQACFRELAFWNAVRKLAGFTVDDMAKTPQMAQRAKHPDAVWPHGLMVRMPGTADFVSAKPLLMD